MRTLWSDEPSRDLRSVGDVMAPFVVKWFSMTLSSPLLRDGEPFSRP